MAMGSDIKAKKNFIINKYPNYNARITYSFFFQSEYYTNPNTLWSHTVWNSDSSLIMFTTLTVFQGGKRNKEKSLIE